MNDTAGILATRLRHASISSGVGTSRIGVSVLQAGVSTSSELEGGADTPRDGRGGTKGWGLAVSGTVMVSFTCSTAGLMGGLDFCTPKDALFLCRRLEPESLPSGAKSTHVACLNPFLQARQGGVPS